MEHDQDINVGRAHLVVHMHAKLPGCESTHTSMCCKTIRVNAPWLWEASWMNCKMASVNIVIRANLLT